MKFFPYEDLAEPGSVDMNADGLAKVVRLFHRQQSSGFFPGGQLVLRRNGKMVLNETAGIAHGFRPDESIPSVPVRPDTPFPVLSAGKSLAAISIALLEDWGLLNVNSPIAEIFPEFALHGKQHITTLDVLTHRSGMLMPDFVEKEHLWSDREAVRKALIDTVPAYPRGTTAYLPLEYGWILSEIVSITDGRSLPDFFAGEIAGPLKLPALRYGQAGRDTNSLAFTYWLGKNRIKIAGKKMADHFEEHNSELYISAKNPASCLVTDAASLAAFYEFLVNGGRTPAGKQLLSEKTIRKYTRRHVLSWEKTVNTVVSLGMGFVVGTLFPSSFGWWNTKSCFGHPGGFCCLAFGDHKTKIAAAIVTNGNRSIYDFIKRFLPLAHGLRKACNGQDRGVDGLGE